MIPPAITGLMKCNKKGTCQARPLGGCLFWHPLATFANGNGRHFCKCQVQANLWPANPGDWQHLPTLFCSGVVGSSSTHCRPVCMFPPLLGTLAAPHGQAALPMQCRHSHCTLTRIVASMHDYSVVLVTVPHHQFNMGCYRGHGMVHIVVFQHAIS